MSVSIEQQKTLGFAVELVWRTLGMSRSAQYQRATDQRSARAVADKQLIAVIRRVHAENFAADGYARCSSRSSAPASRSFATASSA